MSDQSQRRRHGFSVRVLMLLVLALAVCLGWVTNKTREQMRAVEAIRTYGGFVHYDYEMVNGRPVAGREPWAPRWLRGIVGDEYFQDVAYVSLVFDNSGGPRLETSRTDDSVLRELQGMGELRFLLLHDGQATDAGLANLRELETLEGLWMWDARSLTDAGVSHLRGLTNLESLHISNSKMTDEGLRHLAGLTRLVKLGLQGNHFTDAGLAHVEGLTNLKILVVGLGDCRITDAGLVHLRGLTNLELLGLQDSEVTDAGLMQLVGLDKLKEIWVTEEKGLITPEGIKRLQEAMPNLKTVR